ncbi:bifunctional lysylphosphatidylglycerol flippase/synthetase MprF [Siminovitchia acidinfaciens]|uniref:Phosphatidylglycerol lysyltransferase n=1 Tax=Siminovitchia acidinfaciens TaxID=2321395 RepID=A0A429Y839_9BACI|nr:bifunctional lysylphosphatidylglycerol flippase/synthetase MprF [Siminovitchia acidinfaciens]RST77595.1 bifunctional lysylphosphatidylglycerol flippase/synthetase MprF [Siminovitchia acidinfaciens]
MQNSLFNRILSYLKVIFPLALLILAGYEIQKFIKGLDYPLLQREMAQIQFWDMAVTLLVVAAAIVPMFFYDVIMVKLLGIDTPKKKLVKQSLVANTFSNLIGFGGLIGLMIRTYYYRTRELEKKKVLTTIASVSLFYLTGISLFSWIILAGYRDIPLLVNTKWLYLAVIVVALYLPVLLFVIHKKGTDMSIKVRAQLVLVSFCEWGAIFIVICFLVRMLHIQISFHDLFSVFIVACCAGIVSMIPGGLGSFDLVFIWGTDYLGIQDEKVLVLLMLYRIGYFFIPFLIAGALFLKDYWDRWNEAWDNVPNSVIQTVSHFILTVLVFISGLLLLLSASVPGIVERLRLAEEFLSFPIMNVSHQLTVAAGFVLLGLSRGIEYKVKRAYHIAMAVLSIAAVLSLFKGLDYEEAIFLLVVVLLLRISKDRFYRQSYVLSWSKTIFDVAIIFIITFMYVLIGYLNLPEAKVSLPTKLLPYVITDYQDLFFSAFIGLWIAVLVFIAGYIIGRPRKMIMEKSVFQEEEVYEHVNKYGGNVLTHLIFLHDKYLFWNSKKTVLFPYQMYADKLIILGDPVGDRKDMPSAIEEFQQVSDLYGYTPVFYEVSMNMLPYLHESGFDFFKLGEEGFVELNEFSLSGKKMKGERAVINKFKRENYTFEIIKPPFSSESLSNLKEVSDDWLQGRREKGYSLGFFEESYLNKSDIAILKDENGYVTAFSSLMPVYDDHHTISVDLMRFKQNSPSGTMDFIFLSLFEWAKEEGYGRFNLGMAPLSNVGLSKYSFLGEKIGSQIYLHGQFFYHFKGLRQFKEKYVDEWDSKYMAYRKKSSLPITMLQVTNLIGRKRQRSG